MLFASLIISLCRLLVVRANENLFREYLNFKVTNRGVYVSCEQVGKKFVNFDSVFMVYYDLDLNNDKLKNIAVDFEDHPPNIGIFYNLNCKNSGTVLEEISKSSDTFLGTKFWLLLSENREIAMEILSCLKNVRLDSDITLITGNKQNYKVYDVYQMIDNSLIVNEMATHFLSSTDDIEKDINVKSKVIRRRDFLGVTLKGGIALKDDYESYEVMIAHLKNKDDLDSDTMQRKNYHVALILKEMFNFSLQLIKTTDWGYIQNNVWNGIVGLNYYNKTEFSVTSMRMLQSRIPVIDYLPCTHTFYSGFLFRHPRKLQHIRNDFLEPFKSTVWTLVFILSLFASLVFRLIASFDKNPTPTESSLSSLLLIIFGAVMQQGTSNNVGQLSGRILYTSILMFSFLLYQFYSAFLVASLLSEPPKKINTLEKLYGSGLRIGMEDIAYSYALFNETSDMSRKFLRKRILNSIFKNVLATDDGLKLVEKGGFAYHIDSLVAYRYLSRSLSDRKFCELMTIPIFAPFKTSFSLPKKSQLKEFFASGVLRIIESGILDYQDKVFNPDVPNCKMLAQQPEEIVIGIDTIVPLMLLLLSAMVLSLIILLLECLLSKFVKK